MPQIDTSGRTVILQPNVIADRMIFGVVMMAGVALFAFLNSEAFHADSSRHVRALIRLGFTPSQIAFGFGMFSTFIAVGVAVKRRAIARTTPSALVLSPDRLEVAAEAGGHRSLTWHEVRGASVVRKSASLKVLRIEASSGPPIVVEHSQVRGELESAERAIESYLSRYGHQAG